MDDYINRLQYVDSLPSELILVNNCLLFIAYSVEVISIGLLNDEGTFCKDIWRTIDLVYLLLFFLNFFVD